MKISLTDYTLAVIGASGLVGSKVLEIIDEKYNFKKVIASLLGARLEKFYGLIIENILY